LTSNYAQVQEGFRLLRDALSGYVCRELKQYIGAHWWSKGVMEKLYEDQRRDLPTSGEWPQLVDSLDIARSLLLFDLHWSDVFRKKLSIDHRTWAKELSGVRNKLAHLGGKDFTDDDAWRALDTMSRLCDQINPDRAEEIRAHMRVVRYGSADGSTTMTETSPASIIAGQADKSAIVEKVSVDGLPGWRDVIEPHPDVAQGRYRKAEFAADLAQVARGEGAFEYRDPVEFFARTYVTEGMTGLLAQSLRRVCGLDGEPVIQLKTAFGGGKTHSMLALFHMMGGKVSIDKIPGARPVLTCADVSVLPKANVAVLVGTALDPTKSRRPPKLPGITINTLWGEMAAQLAESAGKPGLYDLVKESDKKGVSPGSVTLRNLFDAAAPSLVLMDELVSYAKKLYGARDLPAGTFDNFIVFLQEVSEAAKASKNSLVVASIPESDIEIGGEAGHSALETIEHTFGRMESIWKPVAASEGFEVVRRRLFLDCKKTDMRDLVCSRFSQMYNQNQSDFPLETRELDYRERMVSCYPIHPEVFDRLYEDWATLERFQRTRGVLRLMAAVIHELWMGNDASAMIMPGSIPLDAPNVRDELTRHLSDGWNAIVDREVDGKKSIPFQTDKDNPRYGGKLAARRVARTIMLGSAPTVRGQKVRGIEASRIRLGVVQPGEFIANFNDALTELEKRLAYLNHSSDRFWYDTRPTLRKTVDDRATQVPDSDVVDEIERRVRKFRKEPPFSGIHVCPSSSLDVPDDKIARLVLLRPGEGYKPSSPDDNQAIHAVTDFLNCHGNTPRLYRNMLSFIAPDHAMMANLKDSVRKYLAWKSIKEDSEVLNLDATQNHETDNGISRASETVDGGIKETYCWLMVPHIDRSSDIKTIVWEATSIRGGDEGIVTKAAKKMGQNEQIISCWAPAVLLMELDNVLWPESNDIPISKLWDDLCKYCYLPRLAAENVLIDAIRDGVNSTEYFAVASRFDGNRYIDLKFNQQVDIIDKSACLVKLNVAMKQLALEASRPLEETGGMVNSTGNGLLPPRWNIGDGTQTTRPTYGSGVGGGLSEVQETPASATLKMRRFFMSTDLDNTRINRDVQKFVEEIIQNLTSVDGAKVKVSLEIEAKSTDGFTQSTVRTISENCRTLHVKDYGFEE
jgi:predicted AAA+ superfamily ATPase